MGIKDEPEMNDSSMMNEENEDTVFGMTVDLTRGVTLMSQNVMSEQDEENARVMAEINAELAKINNRNSPRNKRDGTESIGMSRSMSRSVANQYLCQNSTGLFDLDKLDEDLNYVWKKINKVISTFDQVVN